jgi:hypothetical protein
VNDTYIRIYGVDELPKTTYLFLGDQVVTGKDSCTLEETRSNYVIRKDTLGKTSICFVDGVVGQQY